ncbi:squalene/phytoene synthase family protein [Streptomyces montanisoli]|uniref:Squalene/phytoene synthase family protein n=1 Tax=Streptomyces montanisoli TaxID=2798581 RepID=A0A940M9S1_9ACTN|nr:squalene/phytoene synthase family protein [Streptomyces montanisoli]MBP0456973.1 squalene/phytoene synthase family protein [Streptomyces montanisoli]
MRSWRRCLDLAGVRPAGLRADYTTAARYLRRREPALYGVVRVQSPGGFLPHALTGASMLGFTDDVCDTGTPGERLRQLDAWTGHVTRALDTGDSHHPLLRAFVHSAEAAALPRKWFDSYLAGTRIDLEFPGFADEADYQHYIDTLTWPGIMLSTGLTPHLVPDDAFAASCRLVADACQRTDLLTDLTEDIAEGRLALPLTDLEQHGVSRSDLERGRPTRGVRALVLATADRARATLLEAGRVVGEVPVEFRPLVRVLLGLYHHRLDTIGAMGAEIVRRPVRDDPVECLRLVADSRREPLALGLSA